MIKEFMATKKKRIERQKQIEEAQSRERAERIMENLKQLNEKSNNAVAKNLDSRHSKTSKLRKLIQNRPDFSLETYVFIF